MDILLWIVVSIFTVFVIVALVFIIKLNSRGRKGSEIHISGGANIERGYLSNDSNYFKGGYDSLGETLVVGTDYRTYTGEVKYVVFTDIKNGKTFSLSIKDSVVLGRAKEVGVFTLCSDSSISKKHCRIIRIQGQLYVEDLGSSNHTYLNSRMLTNPCRITSGDILRLGNTSLKVQI